MAWDCLSAVHILISRPELGISPLCIPRCDRMDFELQSPGRRGILQRQELQVRPDQSPPRVQTPANPLSAK